MTAMRAGRNPRLSPFEMLAAAAKMRRTESYAEEVVFLQLCGHYPDDRESRSLYRAAAERWGVTVGPRLVESERNPAVFDFAAEAVSQVGEATERLAQDFSILPRVPWPSLHTAIGHGLLPDHFWTVAADSGQGKTTWVMSLVESWITAKRRVFGLPLEQGIDASRVYLAALASNLSVKSVLKNDWSALPSDARGTLARHLDWQAKEGAHYLHLHRDGRVTPHELPDLFREAKDFGAEVFFIDHIHRIKVRSYDEYASLPATIKELSKEWKIPTIATAQNHRGVGPVDRVKAHLIPNVDRIQGGKVLEQESDVVLGVYRPFVADISDETMAEIRRGTVSAREHLQPFTVGVAGLKGRIEGEVGWVVNLKWDRGRIVDPEEEQQKATENRYNL